MALEVTAVAVEMNLGSKEAGKAVFDPRRADDSVRTGFHAVVTSDASSEKYLFVDHSGWTKWR
jgi:hypothetical protein